jgi:hypothetical protein
MNRVAAACPNCAAPLSFAWSGSVQTVCTHCQSIVVRHDVDLQRVGTASDPPPDTSPIQLGTRGRFDGRAFEVIGRIAYEYDGGAWSEWHLLFDGGRTGWLSDAQLRYAVYERVTDAGRLPLAGDAAIGAPVTVAGQQFEVETITDARYRGTEGELPFESWDRETSRFADLWGVGAHVGTIDYSDDPPVLYAGRRVPFEELGLRNLRDVDRARAVPVGALKCQSCGAPLVLRAAGHSQSVVCGHCGSIADAKDPNVGILQEATKGPKRAPKIPLGASGDWHGARYEVVGFQYRVITVEGVDYGWDEYVLFNPHHGFRYLSEYDGHWNDIAVLDEAPAGVGRGLHGDPQLGDRTFRHFQSATARTAFVLGEFPWVVKVGERVLVHDYVAPPFLLSSEGTVKDSTWSMGTYTRGEALWRAFEVKGSPPQPVGVFANQPSPVSGSWSYWGIFALFAVLIVVAALVRMATLNIPVFSGDFRFDPGAPESALVTDPFELTGRTSSVDVSIGSDLSNNWLHFALALINEETGEALDFERGLEYYFGVEDGESWSSGSTRGGVRVPSVPAGRYYLRVEPEGDPASRVPVQYNIRVRRDPPAWGFYGIALGLLLVPPLLVTWRHASFERQRWSQSDHAPSDDEDDE